MHAILRTLCLCVVSVTGLMAQPHERLVLQEPSPREGIRVVKTTSGNMLTYEQRIPGTDITFTMEPVPAGTLQINDGGKLIEIEIPAFWIGKCEVTFGEFEAYMQLNEIVRNDRYTVRDGGRRSDSLEGVDVVSAPTTIYEPSWRFEYVTGLDAPMVSMSQFGAKKYTHFLSLMTGDQYRLPSEAEWEYACRAGSKTKYAHGDDNSRLGEFSVYHEAEDFDGPPPVASRKPNAWGIHDMHGSVSEWVLDGNHPRGLLRLSAGTHSVADSIFWPTDRKECVVKGGSWLSEAEDCRTRSRQISSDDWWEEDPHLPKSLWWLSSDKMRTIGFRVLSPLRKETREAMNKFWLPSTKNCQDDLEETMTHGLTVAGKVDPQLFRTENFKWSKNALGRTW